MVPLVSSSIITGIARIGNEKAFGRLGGKTFAFIAEQWLKMMRNEVEKRISTKAKVDSYEAITRRYHIPYFNKTKITEITPKSLAAYETWRAEYWTAGPGAVAEFETITRQDGKTYTRKTKRVARGKMDAEDTVLRQIFKFAVKEEYLPVARMPTIGGKKQVGNGTQSTRRPAFTKEQAGKLLDYDANAFYPITAKMDAAILAMSVEEMKADMRNNKVDLANMSISDLGIYASPDAALKLSTLHNAKGREYQAVAMIDLHEGKIPFYQARTTDEFEEAKRLFYVGVTRAKRYLLYVTDGSDRRNTPSRFLRTGTGVGVC